MVRNSKTAWFGDVIENWTCNQQYESVRRDIRVNFNGSYDQVRWEQGRTCPIGIGEISTAL